MSEVTMLRLSPLPAASRGGDALGASRAASNGASDGFATAMRDARGRSSERGDELSPEDAALAPASDAAAPDEVARESEPRDEAPDEAAPEAVDGQDAADDEPTVDEELVPAGAAAAGGVQPEATVAKRESAAAKPSHSPAPEPVKAEPVVPVAVVPDRTQGRHAATAATEAVASEVKPVVATASSTADGQSASGEQQQQQPGNAAALQMADASKSSAAPSSQASPAPVNPVADTAATAPSPQHASSQAATGGAPLTHDAPDVENVNVARLARGLQSALAQQGGNVTLRLTPPELGTVRIQLQIQGGQVSANFQAGNESARAMLNHQMMHLRSALEAQGLSVERLSVSPTNQSPAGQLQQQGQQAGQQQANTSGQPSQHQSATDGRSRGEYSQQQSQQQGGDRQPDRDRQAPRRFADWFDTSAFNPAA